MLVISIISALSWIWIPALIIFLVFKSRKPATGSAKNDLGNQRRDSEWREYLTSFQSVVKTKSETALLEAMIRGDSRDQYDSASAGRIKVNAIQPLAVAELSATSSASALETNTNQSIGSTPPKAKIQLDNTLLLLYFGAFLLVASVGLFVAIGGLSGLIRTIIVAITAAVLYVGGMWLYDNNQKLAQAGISFVGSGMIIAPLTGVAWYNLVSLKADGGIIWLLTSVVCIGLYASSYKRIKNDFVAYLLIGSLVSAVESSVLTLGLPTYGYAWGLVVLGIALQIIKRRRGLAPQLEVSTATSAELMVPLSVIGSAVLFPNFGSLQLAVTLILSGSYYALLSSWQGANRRNYSLAAQVSYLAALANLVYAYQHSLVAVGLSLIAASAVYAAVIAVTRPQLITDFGLMDVSIATNLIAVLLCLSNGWSLVAGLAVGVLLAGVLWQKFNRDDALQAAGLLLISLPFVIALYATPHGLNSLLLLSLSAVVAIIIAALVVDTIVDKQYQLYYSSASGLYWAALAALLVPAIALGAGALVLVVALILASCVLLRRLSQHQAWLIGSSLVVFIPLVYLASTVGIGSHQFSLAVLAALVWNAALSLVTREALIRWLVVVSLSLAPLALGAGGLGWHWGPVGYSLGYLAAMLACLLARAIARGKLLVSFKVPIASYYTQASQAYVVGYVTAGLASLFLSLYSDQSRLLTTALLAVMALVVLAVVRIERQPEVLALLPLVLQLAIFSGLRPDLQQAGQVGVAALVLVVAAVASYLTAGYLNKDQLAAARLVQRSSLYLSYTGAALVFTQQAPSRLLAVSLFVAGCLTVYHNRARPQTERELSVGVCLAAVHWLLYLSGVHALQVHTHILAVFLAGYAYWRSQLGDSAGARGYVQALFLVVTIPLALQSLGGAAGGNYGLLLIAEQVAFMIVGTLLPADDRGQHFLLRWGLWTGLAAILFQLRGLGWAFLSLLAVIIIAVAVYRLQKTPHDKL